MTKSRRSGSQTTSLRHANTPGSLLAAEGVARGKPPIIVDEPVNNHLTRTNRSFIFEHNCFLTTPRIL
ncbi:hypothetical protein BDZ89DRAFT_1062668 [Hymenopellis radicata]|nr:hypothetical protein BDZ89DRAFT_1062668 [Hymenopellis radicata]